MESFAGCMLALGAMWLVIMLAVSLGHIDQAQINAACEGRGGVISYSDHTWGVTAGSGTVVCGDRKARVIN